MCHPSATTLGAFAYWNVPMPYLPIHLLGTNVNGILNGMQSRRVPLALRGILSGYQSCLREQRLREPVDRRIYELSRELVRRGCIPLDEIEVRLPSLKEVSRTPIDRAAPGETGDDRGDGGDDHGGDGAVAEPEREPGFEPEAGVVVPDERAGDVDRLRELDLLADQAVEVREVTRGSLAESAGIEPGDIIVALAGRLVTSIDDLHRLLMAVPQDQALQLTVIRNEIQRLFQVPPQSS